MNRSLICINCKKFQFFFLLPAIVFFTLKVSSLDSFAKEKNQDKPAKKKETPLCLKTKVRDAAYLMNEGKANMTLEVMEDIEIPAGDSHIQVSENCRLFIMSSLDERVFKKGRVFKAKYKGPFAAPVYISYQEGFMNCAHQERVSNQRMLCPDNSEIITETVPGQQYYDDVMGPDGRPIKVAKSRCDAIEYKCRSVDEDGNKKVYLPRGKSQQFIMMFDGDMTASQLDCTLPLKSWDGVVNTFELWVKEIESGGKLKTSIQNECIKGPIKEASIFDPNLSITDERTAQFDPSETEDPLKRVDVIRGNSTSPKTLLNQRVF